MPRMIWTTKDIRNILKTDSKFKSTQTLFNAEDRGLIPRASKIKRGKIQVRQWRMDQIPEIGKVFGYLEPLGKQIVISVYIKKGGVEKTTISLNVARSLALNGIKTILIGLDSEVSITSFLGNDDDVTSISDIKNEEPQAGLYEYFQNNLALKDVIRKTEIPTLDYIPESPRLDKLEMAIQSEMKREFKFKKQLLPELSDYDVVLFDHAPSTHVLATNGIVASDIILVPLACTVTAYRAMETNLEALALSLGCTERAYQPMIFIPVQLDRTSIAQGIYASYVNQFSGDIVPIPIRISSKGNESMLARESYLEYAPKSPLATEFYDLMAEIWRRAGEKINLDSVESPQLGKQEA